MSTELKSGGSTAFRVEKIKNQRRGFSEILRNGALKSVSRSQQHLGALPETALLSCSDESATTILVERPDRGADQNIQSNSPECDAPEPSSDNYMTLSRDTHPLSLEDQPQGPEQCEQKHIEEVLDLLTSPSSPLKLGLSKCLECSEDPLIATLAAFFLLQGLGGPKNPEGAIELLTRHQGDPRAKALLAECYIFGHGVETDFGRGLKLLESAHNEGDLYAYLVTGDCVRLGVISSGVPETEMEYDEYHWVLQSNCTRYDTPLMKYLANVRLAQALEGRMAATYLRGMVEFAYPSACYDMRRKLLGHARETTHCRHLLAWAIVAQVLSRFDPQLSNYLQPCLKSALRYFLDMVKYGDLDFQKFATKHRQQLNTIGRIDYDFWQTLEVLLAKSDERDQDIQLTLGLCYYFGYGVDRDGQKAFELYVDSANQENAYAQFWVGWCYRNAEGTQRDHKLAFDWFLKSAQQNLVEAQVEVAECYLWGYGATQDSQQAFEWYFKAAKAGSAVAQTRLAMCYRRGYGIARCDKLALHWYMKAASQDCVDAQYTVGEYYEHGRGVAASHSSAFEWYLRAANQGHAGAQSCVADFYRHGHGVAENPEQAFKWYVKSAKEGNMDAMRKVGWCYKMGYGIVQDPFKGAYWESSANSR